MIETGLKDMPVIPVGTLLEESNSVKNTISTDIVILLPLPKVLIVQPNWYNKPYDSIQYCSSISCSSSYYSPRKDNLNNKIVSILVSLPHKSLGSHNNATSTALLLTNIKVAINYKILSATGTNNWHIKCKTNTDIGHIHIKHIYLKSLVLKQ